MACALVAFSAILLVYFSGAIFSRPLFGSRCTIRAEQKTVRGNSLSGLIESGRTVTVLAGYYGCHEPERNDVVIYLYGGAAANGPLIKIVKAIPGDVFSLQKASDGWNIIVNGAPLKNMQGLPYAINDAGFRMLSLYANDYHNVIPPGAYLILGNLPGGSRDSEKFGLVGKQDFVGKVVVGSD